MLNQQVNRLTKGAVNEIPFEQLLWFAVVATIFVVAVLGAERMMDRKVKSEPRPDNRVPKRDRELLGDDWRGCLKPDRDRSNIYGDWR